MQNEIKDIITNFIRKEESKFINYGQGQYIELNTGEFFSETDYNSYLQKKLEQKKAELFAEANIVAMNEYGIENQQSIVVKKKKKKKGKLKEKLDNGEFNIIYRTKIGEIIDMKLTNNEKLVYYILRDFIEYPTNCIMINNNIPTIKSLEPIVGLSERSIINAIKSLEEKNLFKRVQVGHKKAIYINPDYYASGKEIDIDTLKLFGLIKYDKDKVEKYLKDK